MKADGSCLIALLVNTLVLVIKVTLNFMYSCDKINKPCVNL